MKDPSALISLVSNNIVFYGHPAEYLNPDDIDFGAEPVAKRHLENIGPHVYALTKELTDYTKELGFESKSLSSLLRDRKLLCS